MFFSTVRTKTTICSLVHFHWVEIYPGDILQTRTKYATITELPGHFFLSRHVCCVRWIVPPSTWTYHWLIDWPTVAEALTLVWGHIVACDFVYEVSAEAAQVISSPMRDGGQKRCISWYLKMLRTSYDKTRWMSWFGDESNPIRFWLRSGSRFRLSVECKMWTVQPGGGMRSTECRSISTLYCGLYWL